MLQKSLLIGGYCRSNWFYRIVNFWGSKNIYTSSLLTFVETVPAYIIMWPDLLEPPLKLMGHLVSLWGGIKNLCCLWTYVSRCQCHHLTLIFIACHRVYVHHFPGFTSALQCTPFPLPTLHMFFSSCILTTCRFFRKCVLVRINEFLHILFSTLNMLS